MTEFNFALKTFAAAALILTLMQIRVSGSSVERHMEGWLENSKVAHFVQGAAAGGVLAAKDLYKTVSEVASGSKTESEFKASR